MALHRFRYCAAAVIVIIIIIVIYIRQSQQTEVFLLGALNELYLV